jgi:hypothetical protein
LNIRYGVEKVTAQPVVVVVRARRTELVDHLEVLLDVVGNPVEEEVLVDRAVRTTFAGRAVVRAIEDDRIVELA